MKTISIIGGGLAGLALGIGLRNRDVPVTLFEAGKYPRHRVCGEVISGIHAETLNNLGILHHLVDAEICTSTGWFHRGKIVYARELPTMAYGMSRYLLDFRMARNFKKLEGRLLDETEYMNQECLEGRVWSVGQTRDNSSPWIALKLHCESLPLTHDLEMHLGDQCYVALSRIEDKMVNVCGLFKKRKDVEAKKHGAIFAYLKASGLELLAERILQSKPDPTSLMQMTGLNFQRNARFGKRVRLGDNYAMSPPFTGNGIAMALEGAEIALEPLTFYAKGAMTWPEARSHIQKLTKAHFRKRLRNSRRIHPLLCNPQSQKIGSQLARSGLLPFDKLFRMTH